MRLFIYLMSVLLLFALPMLGKEDKKGQRSLNKGTVLGDIVKLNINNIDLPLENDGSTGDNGLGHYPNGSDLTFLFQGGIAASGKVNGESRVSWMAKASLIQEYQPGPWGTSPDAAAAKFYVVGAADEFGSQSYLDYADAVSLGAPFQDLDGDGSYSPSTDRPDILGDQVVWCVYNDNTDLSQRTPRLQTNPIGLEVQQTAWAFARGDELGDVVFIRYRFINTNTVPIDSLIFSIWTDPDLGDFNDDLIGSDVARSMGYIYNDGDDAEYGNNPPAFGVDFFQGPIVESPGDVALLYKGPFFGIDTVQNFRNLPLTSFTYYINGDPTLSDPSNATIARNYQVGGLDADGDPIDPTEWGIGGTAATNNRFFYSGDPGDPDANPPRNPSGWIDNTPADKRFMVNTGPFTLLPGTDNIQDIVVAYIVSQGVAPQNAVTELQRKDDIAQLAYNANFFVAGPPPVPVVNVRTDNKEIELIVDLEARGTFDYDAADLLLNRQVFEGINVYQFRSESTADVVNGVQNKRLIASFDLANDYGNIFLRDRSGEWKRIFSGQNNLDPVSYADDGSAIFTYRVTSDAFTQGELLNGQTYFFSVTSFSLNLPFLRQDVGGAITGNASNWLAGSSADYLENSLSANLVRVAPQSDEVRPFRNTLADYGGSRSNYSGNVFADVVRPADLTGDQYEVSFFDDGTSWKLTRFSNSGASVLLDSMSAQAIGDPLTSQAWNFPIVDGLSVGVYNSANAMDTAIVTLPAGQTTPWIASQSELNAERSAFTGGIGLTILEKPQFANYSKAEYFPVRIDFLTEPTSVGYRWQVGSFIGDPLFRGADNIRLAAYDISNPDNPRQLNICFNNSTAGLTFNPITDIYIMSSDYDPATAYVTPGATAAFREETYMILTVQAVADSLIGSFPFSIEARPFYPNSDADIYRFSSAGLEAELESGERQALLDRVKAVPNPYFAVSTYETSYDASIMRFTHIDQEAVLRIFNVAGQLVRRLEKNDSSNEVQWDLRNEAGLRVASGMYIVHIEVPGVGERVLKVGVVQREERIDRF